MAVEPPKVTEGSIVATTARLVFRHADPDADASWLASAWGCPGYADLVGDERPSTQEGAAALLKERAQAGFRDLVFVARATGERVGRGSVQPAGDGGASAEIELEIPDGRFRGQGLGKEALEALMAMAAQGGARRVMARILADNDPSRALARALGFEIHGRTHGAGGRAMVRVARAIGGSAA